MGRYGYGYTKRKNTIAWDADALSFISTVGITDDAEKRAANYYVTEFKRYGLWTKSIAIYPFLGGTSVTHSYNLKNTAAHRITWVNSPSHSGLGVTFSGSAYGRTGIIPSTHMTLSDTTGAFYSRSEVNATTTSFGAVNSATQQFRLYPRTTGSIAANAYNATGVVATVADSIQLSVVSKTALNSLKLFKRGVQQGSTVTTAAGTLPSIEIYIGATNSAGVAALHWSGQVSFLGFLSGLTDQEVSDLDRIVEYVQL